MNLLNSDVLSIYPCVFTLIYSNTNKVEFNVFLFAVIVIAVTTYFP